MSHSQHPDSSLEDVTLLLDPYMHWLVWDMGLLRCDMQGDRCLQSDIFGISGGGDSRYRTLKISSSKCPQVTPGLSHVQALIAHTAKIPLPKHTVTHRGLIVS